MHAFQPLAARLFVGGALLLASSCSDESSDGTPAGAGGTATWGLETRPLGQTCQVHSASQQPALLSASGCVDPSDPTKPAATLVPYDVSSPLWSDGASKQRYFALPDDTTIHVKDCSEDTAACKEPNEGGSYEDEGDWGFPDGTVFMKTFAFEGKLVETRLLQKRDDDNWWGYSYEWHEDQADAELVDSDGADAMVAGPEGMLNWHFPSRSQCLQCHTTASGISLGLETSQLNFDFTYPNGARGNQVVTLEHAGFFEASPALRPVYPAPSDATLALEARARSYLHSNCAMCHRPGGNFTDFDARFSTALEDTELCNVDPDKAIPPDITVTNPKRIAAGDPASSVVSLRMHSLDPNFRMPQIGSRVVDEPGAQVVDDWISSLTDCP